MVDLLRILLPTDFSEASQQAAKYAIALADRFGAELHALHVVEAIAPSVPEAAHYMATLPEDWMKKAREHAERHLKAWLPTDRAGEHSIIRAVREGSPYVQIVDYASENHIDLIVIGTHGRSGLAHVLIGSVAERVVRHAACPVLTVRPTGERSAVPRGSGNRH